MKITIRGSVFETNSSSNHSLIISNKKDLKEDVEKNKLDENFYHSYGAEENPIITKEDKCFFLQGIFEESLSSKKCSISLYNIFKKVLKDNNETEILNDIEQHMIDNKNNYYAFYCEDYFCHGVLCDCSCNFLKLLEQKYNIYLWLAPSVKITKNVDYILDSDPMYEETRKEIYDMFYDYIYSDLVVIPFEFL